MEEDNQKVFTSGVEYSENHEQFKAVINNLFDLFMDVGLPTNSPSSVSEYMDTAKNWGRKLIIYKTTDFDELVFKGVYDEGRYKRGGAHNNDGTMHLAWYYNNRTRYHGVEVIFDPDQIGRCFSFVDKWNIHQESRYMKLNDLDLKSTVEHFGHLPEPAD